MTTKTELLNNGVVVATKTAAPFYSWDWTPATSGASSLTYKRYEDNVLVFTSAAITGTVEVVEDTTAPTVPTNMAVATKTDTTANLTWTASTDAVGVVSYNVYKDAVLYSNVASNSETVTGLTASTAYSFTVSALDEAGNQSAQSTALAVTTNVASSYDVDYQAKLSKATELGIPHPSAAQSDIYNQKIIDFKTTDGWSQSPVVMDFSGVADIQFKLICIKRRVLGISYGPPTWSSDGWLGDGTTAYIDPLYDTTSDAKWLLNNAGVSWVNFQTASAGAVTGAYTGTADDYVLIAPKTGHIGINGNNTATVNYTKLGFSSVNRISATQVMRNNVAVTANSNTRFAGELLIGCRDRIDLGTRDSFYDGGISFICMGGASTDYTAMKTILEA